MEKVFASCYRPFWVSTKVIQTLAYIWFKLIINEKLNEFNELYTYIGFSLLSETKV